jgi:hypothetical protein
MGVATGLPQRALPRGSQTQKPPAGSADRWFRVFMGAIRTHPSLWNHTETVAIVNTKPQMLKLLQSKTLRSVFCRTLVFYNLNRYLLSFFFHLAAAAFFAAATLCAFVILFARAFPPLDPPNLPRATAAGFFPTSGSGRSISRSPVTPSTRAIAKRFGSGSFGFLARLGMVELYSVYGGKCKGIE